MTRSLSVLISAFWLLIAMPVTVLASELVTPLNEKLVAVDAATQGLTREEAVTIAKEEAVLATAGRVLIDSKLIRADELLEKYLRNYADQFVLGVEVKSDTFTGGLTAITSTVFIDYSALVADLKEKRFLYRPAYKPQAVSFIEERLEGRRIEEPARPIFQTALQAQGFKIYDGVVSDPPADTYVGIDPLLLESAIVACERRNIEIIFTGTSQTRLREERKVYYDNFYFYDCEMQIEMIRVDTGEVLHKGTATGSASARDRADAITTAISRAAETLAAEHYQAYRETWPDLVQFSADYELLLTGANSELTSIIIQQLQRLGPDVEIHLKKSLFEKTAVITLKSKSDTKVPREELLEVLRSCTYPILTIIREQGDNKFEIQVTG